MSNRLATRIGLLAGDERAPDALDLVRFREPTTGSEVRTKGSLFLLAQVTGGDPALGRAAAEALETIERARAVVDELVVLATPSQFWSVGSHYAEFGQVSDEEVVNYLTLADRAYRKKDSRVSPLQM